MFGQGPGKRKTGKVDSRSFGEEAFIRTYEYGHRVRKPLYHMLTFTRENHYGRCTKWPNRWNNERVDTSQPLSLAARVLAQCTHEQNSHDGRDGNYVWAQQREISFTKADIATTTAECEICKQKRPILSPQYSTNSWGDQQATCQQVDYNGSFRPQKGNNTSWLE